MTALPNHFQNTSPQAYNPSDLEKKLVRHQVFVVGLNNLEQKTVQSLSLPEKSIVVEKDNVKLRAGHYHLDDLELAELTLSQRHSLYKNESSLLDELRVKAAEGDPNAQYEHASYSRSYFASTDDLRLALDLLKKSADQGHTSGMMGYVDLVLSCKKSQLFQVSGHLEELEPDSQAFVTCAQGLEMPSDEILVSSMRYLINQGCVRYHQDLAHLYYVGWGVPQDRFMAFVHYMYSLLYGPENDTLLESEELFQEQLEAIFLDHFAMYDVSDRIGRHIAYLNEAIPILGTEDLFVEEFDFDRLELHEKVVVAFVMSYLKMNDIAFKWFQNISAQRQHPCLDLMMGTYLYHQQGDDDQYALAHTYLSRAGEENPINLIQLAQILFQKSDYQNAVKYFEQAADAGVKYARQRLAEIHRSGVTGTVDYEKAHFYLKDIVLNEAEDEEILYLQGKMYLKGQGVQKDEVRAIALIQKAAYLGHVSAQYRLGCIFERLK